MDRYYLELARVALGKASGCLRDAENYMIRAGADYISSITRITAAADNRNREIGRLLDNLPENEVEP